PLTPLLMSRKEAEKIAVPTLLDSVWSRKKEVYLIPQAVGVNGSHYQYNPQQLDAAGARRLLPGRVLQAGPRASGTGLMARRPLRPVVLPRSGGQRQLQAALVLPGRRELTLTAVHPYPPLSPQAVRDWQHVLRALPGPFEGRRPNILAGDFNATLDHRALRRLLARGYTDAADATGDGLRPTFPSARSLPPITIDHVLVPDTIRVRRISIHEVAGSDHHALIAELVLPPA
ncbi:MAG: endonuclease/exonuclease/phosphatase family protein, partial [Actinobacteria bacterium]|nr:endonuclease/exonuclease/phosphatase family protein [Actinomycetota bacterium]